MKFVADVMLGRLVRFMRFCGYDVEYDRNANDEALLRRSRYRILLTKDRELARRAKPKRVYLVQHVGGEKQLAEIKQRFPLAGASPGVRCLVCNQKLRRVSKVRIEHLVPPFVYQRHTSFYICSRCKRVYWPGTHFEDMSRVLE